MLKKHEKLVSGVVGKYTEVATKRPIHPELVASTLDALLADDAIVTADTGMGNVWQARYITPNGHRRLLGSYSHGSMANALPHAVGAQLAQPGRQVVSLSGDGGLDADGRAGDGRRVQAADHHRRLQQLDARAGEGRDARRRLPRLRGGRADGRLRAGRDGGRHPGIRVEDPREVEAALRDALADPGPVLVDVVTDPLALSLPPTVTGAQVKGFALAMSKMVMNGGAGEAIALARSNVKHALP